MDPARYHVAGRARRPGASSCNPDPDQPADGVQLFRHEVRNAEEQYITKIKFTLRAWSQTE